MSRFEGEDLFGSGPHHFHVHGVEQRHVTHEQPGVDGAAVTAQGRAARQIDQKGMLLADDVASMADQIARIEAAAGGRAGELVDDAGRQWSNVMMLSFEPSAIWRHGARLAVNYQVRYVQVNS
ncbi:MAG: DNA circularization N-terminal domain-containing protein [Phycisphaeraceae bacterium]